MRKLSVLPVALAFVSITLIAQDRLRSMPGYDRAQQMTRESQTAVRGGALAVTWVDDGAAFEYARLGRQYRYDIATRHTTEVGGVPTVAAERGGRPSAGSGQAGQSPGDTAPERGRQFESATSPDGALKASYRDRNLWLSALDGSNAIAITADGSAASRVKYATASWVYGEELSQRTAMWWSPDGTQLAYYGFDESKIPDFYLALDQTRTQDALDTEAYPKAGVPNPVVDLFVYDVATKQSTRMDVRDGKPFDNNVVGHYVYHVEWSRDGRELLFFRTNRRQNIMEVVAANPATGACRVVLREAWPTGWLNSEPRMVFLSDGKRFIWESQRNGWDNYYLYDLSGALIAPLTTSATFEATSLVKIDETARVLFYTARDGDNPLKLQLHRVGLDGTGDRLLTDPLFTHTIGGCIRGLGSRPEQPNAPAPCGISPDSRYFIDVYQTHDTPPATRLVDATTGRTIDELAKSDASKFAELGLKKAEMFTYTAADGQTRLRGLIQFPSGFDPTKTYPALVSVYGGPEFAQLTARETFVTPSPLTEYGFLVLNLDSRGVPGLGKRVLDSLYLKLGVADVDDMAEAVKALWSRPYFDKARVGIFGTSYGGYSAVMAILRHPDVFAAAASSSPPTDWRNYDTIYSERYMWIPQENADGYNAGAAMTYAKNLRGRLLLYYGTADNNVHPSNSLQLIKALQEAGKSFDVQVGPDRGHSGVNQDRMMEFFIDTLRAGGG
ncbi:MAG: DPP IV N-terminal domain-containing protein [Acidobacteria bacterium]|nr:DPP IV N-terminal domain-containing protein [Acidobacteriota bacterium]